MKHVRTAILVFIFWTVVTAGLYPLLMTGVGALFFPRKAQGSLLMRNGKVIGSELLAHEQASRALKRLVISDIYTSLLTTIRIPYR